MKTSIRMQGSLTALFFITLLFWQPVIAGEVTLEKQGFTLTYPDDWAANKHAANTSLQRQPTATQFKKGAIKPAESPNMIISTEDRLNHDGALRRLLQISDIEGADKTWLQISGWPALQQSFLRDRPQPSGGMIDGSETVLVIQTVVAMGATLVRMETWLTPDASAAEIAEVKGIGQSMSAAQQGDATNVAKELDNLRNGRAPRGAAAKVSPSVSRPTVKMTTAVTTQPSSDQIPASQVENQLAGLSVPVSTQGGRDSELEIAVGANGRDVVIGSNSTWFFSSDGGQTWNQSALGAGIINGNDPSLAWGQSGGAQGTFYGANIAAPSTGMITSVDGGANWQVATPAYTCAQNGDVACVAGAQFPDQEHIAADRWNVTAGGDQVYSAWRQLNGTWGIVCSADSSNTWSANGLFTNGDLPKPGVGPDGFVYVIYLDNGDIMLDKFAPCEVQTNPMTNVGGFPVLVKANASPVACPTPGLDRCNRRNTLSGITVGVDDTDSNHVYVTYATNTNAGPGSVVFEGSPVCTDQNLCNEDIIVQDSVDGGATWPAASDPGDVCVAGACAISGIACSNNSDCYDDDRIAIVSSGVTARRFMPWLCTMGGNAYVSWYDRRAAFPGGGAVSNNSLTDFYAGSASLDLLGNLKSDGEFQVNDPGTEDAQCEAGFATGNAGSWPSAVDRAGDSESCSQQIQLGGICTGTGTQCDFSDCGGPGNNTGGACLCGAGTTCDIARGSPKYGDYNGNACAAGRLYMTWASAQAPLAAPAATDIDSFFSSEVVCCVPQIQVPGNINFAEACGLDQQKKTLNVCNTGKENLKVNSIVGDTQFAVTQPLANYPVTISPDFCFPFEVTYNPDGTGIDTGTLTINSNDPLNPALAVAVAGSIGVASINTFIADSGDFGEVCSADELDLNLTIQSNGSCDVQIDSVSLNGPDASDFELPNGSLAGTIIEAGNSLLVPVRFAPDNFTDPNPRTATVDVAASTPQGNALPLEITPIQGSVPPPDINLAIANDGDFGKVCKGDHTDLDLTLFNQGRCDLTISNIELLPPGGSFILPSDLDLPLVLSHDADFTLPVRYAPVECNDVAEEAQIKITSDDPDELEEFVDISGASPCPNLVIDPNSIEALFAFPATVVDTSGSLGCYNDRTVVLRNNGECPLTINGIDAAGLGDVLDYGVTSPTQFPIILPSGEETLEVNVRFTPQADDNPLAPSEVLGLLTVMSDDPDGDATGDLCGESAAQSGIRVLTTEISSGLPLAIDGVDRMTISSKGKKTPSPINLQFTDVPLQTASVCNSTISWHIDQETLPNAQTTGSNPNSSYQATAKEGNLQDSQSFSLGQCEFKEFQLQLLDSGSSACTLLPKGAACSNAGECCSGKCTGPNGGKSCK